ncbi:uncharacterized protein LOC105380762 [Plutella xylostella]|uniref:uncharacterized protein LOC105380762 n=1 Tax=Plutella xylostella TaxID=51655 RepID=UPI002032DE6F|nr:uncharacterized protein LOC105380762 [Plutella xylostella]
MADSSEDTPQNIKIKSEPSDSDSTEHVSELQPKPIVFFGVAASNYQDIIKAVSVFNTEDDGDDPLFRKKKQLTADEIRTRWNVHKIFKRLGTQEQCLQFALDRALLPASRLCRRHKTPMKLQTIGDSIGRFQCTKDICRNRAFSRSDHTFFEGCQMQLRLIFEMMYFYSNGYDYEQTQRECYIPDRDAALHLATIAMWFGYCREAVVIYQIKHQKEKPKIGGPGRLVILDESKMGYTSMRAENPGVAIG